VPSLNALPRTGKIKLVAIGTSTGGPLALQMMLSQLPEDFPCALLVVSHMPASYTASFARQLDKLCMIHVREAEDGEALRPATALLAPGGKQMLVGVEAGRPVVRLRDAEPGEIYQPSVDLTFNSIARLFPDRTLALILSGMGEDGLEGCRSLKAGGATVWTQDEDSCVVYGMPAAVETAGLSDRVLSLSDMGSALIALTEEELTS